MRLALDLAQKGMGTTSPNPMVGAVVVQGNVIVGRGTHERPGGPHAEVGAVEEAGNRAEGSTLYVNLEPCSSKGRTDPCVDLILSRRIATVVCAMVDPDPRVSGRGIERLREEGVQVTVGLMEAEAQRLNAFYVKHRTTGVPFVILKLAQTLDGRIATSAGDSRWITGEASRRQSHLFRSQVDGVIVGAGTVRADDPLLTVRHVPGTDPARIVVDSKLKTPPTARVFGRGRVIVATTEDADENRSRELEEGGAEIWRLPSADDRVDLRELMHHLGRRDFLSVMIEGGGTIATSALKAGIVDQVKIFIASKLIGGGVDSVGDLGIEKIADGIRLADVEIERIGEDILYTAMVDRGDATHVHGPC